MVSTFFYNVKRDYELPDLKPASYLKVKYKLQ